LKNIKRISDIVLTFHPSLCISRLVLLDTLSKSY
jgi:hypothetical protein